MSTRKKQSALKGVMGFALSLVITMNIFPVIQLNGSGDVFCNDPAKPGCSSSPFGKAASDEPAEPGLINRAIVQGAAAYLNAYSAYLSFLNRFELSAQNGLDYSEAEKILAVCLYNIKRAKDAYYQLIEASEATPYNPVVLAQLADFDYDKYLKIHQPESGIFKKTREYLQAGDIIGAYMFTYTRVREIENLLSATQSALAFRTSPELQNIWKVNELFSGTLIFGQYTAQVFAAIK